MEKKPCYTETEWEGPHSISSSPGAAIASAGSPLAWVKSAAVNGGRVEVPCECTVAADGQRTWPCMRDRRVQKGERWEAARPVQFLFTCFWPRLVEKVASCKAPSLWGLCSGFGALNPLQLSFYAPKLNIDDCQTARWFQAAWHCRSHTFMNESSSSFPVTNTCMLFGGWCYNNAWTCSPMFSKQSDLLLQRRKNCKMKKLIMFQFPDARMTPQNETVWEHDS